MKNVHSRSHIGIAVVLLSAVALAGCAGGGGGAGGGEPGEEITLKLETFNQFGYTDELLAQFEEQNPGITVEQTKVATAAEARDSLFTKLAAGSGLPDVVAVEAGWVADLIQYSDKFVPVPDTPEEAPATWVDVQTKPATNADGELIYYGVAIGPSAVCYRSDLFAAAGLPTDREEVAALLEGDWQNYFDVGQQYLEGGGSGAWFDAAGSLLSSRVQQLANPYEESDGTVISPPSDEVKEAFFDTADAATTLSAKLAPWSDDWAAGMADGAFATMLCPSWMLGVIEGNAPEVSTWDVANVFPNGGGNSGGSWLAVPTQSANQDAASKLAAWLTAPEQQIYAFNEVGAFPSRVAAYDSEDLATATNAYFNDAPIGTLFADRAQAVEVVSFKGPKYAQISSAIDAAIQRVEAGTQTVEDSWAQFEADVAGVE